ncbi:MAG: 4-hydroxy-tetrahydrodipicolinate reductase [Eubacteriales bacterium]|nr:4-hydroxy-tetrahydrodipicolinate reductase [Eubacteriales bacterium]
MKLILVGASGRMGLAVAENAKDVQIVAGVGEPMPHANFPVYQSAELLHELADCIIDFSHPSTLSAVLTHAVKYHIPCVIGTTALDEHCLALIQQASKQIPVLQSYNLSLGVQTLKVLAKKASQMLQGLYDIEIIEKHHNQKKDAPSGTALMLYEAVKQENSKAVCGREGAQAIRTQNEIGIHSLRGGSLPGEHCVEFLGAYDELQLVHRVRDRKVFAIGALQAAKFLQGKANGLYTTQDIIEESLGNLNG